MTSIPLGIPKGTRDFGPSIMVRRQHILKIIQDVFRKYSFQPLETPSMENLTILSGKYGEEGDQLLYKILDSGDFLKKTSAPEFEDGYQKILPKIASKGLRYDLTVPFARYVVMNRHEITFPFKRYQMQPVWRADRPQKGRYREFYQCDADVIGTNSLLCEAEIIAMINEVFAALGISQYQIQLNHRKLLAGISEVIGATGRQMDLAVSLDKLGKIGAEKVLGELEEKGFNSNQLDLLEPVLHWQGNWTELKTQVNEFLAGSTEGVEGIKDLDEVLAKVAQMGIKDSHVVVNVSLARGLAYYTGSIFEVVVNNVKMGSVCGGGRYDDLTGVFGLPDVSGVGISFGVDRIYDVMQELELFPEKNGETSNVLLISLDNESESYALALLAKLRSQKVASELYPDRSKLKKPLNYANKNQVPLVVLIGSNEISSGKLTVKHMETGNQQQLTEDQLIQLLVN